MRLESAVEMQADAGVVFAVLSTPERLPEWNASVASAQRVGDGPIGVGSRAIFAGRFMGQVLESETRVVAYEPPTLFATRAIRGPRLHTEFLLEPLAGRTRLRARVSGDVPGGALGSMVAERLLRTDLERSLQRLRALCEAG